MFAGTRVTVDSIGRRCPLPIIDLARRLADVSVGELIELWSDDPAAEYDVAAWCRMRAQELVEARPHPRRDGAVAYLIRRVTH